MVNRQRLNCSHTNAKRLSWRKEASFISRTEINTVSESGNVECLKGKMNAGASADSATDINDW